MCKKLKFVMKNHANVILSQIDIINRRELLATATAMGASISSAYASLGLTVPTASEVKPKRGGTARIQQSIIGLKDPRTWDWPQIANFARGWLEYLVEYQNDGTLRVMLLERWTVNEDATEFILTLRDNIFWNTGEKLGAAHIRWLFEYWCDNSVPNNSMASRLDSLVDPNTNTLIIDSVILLDSRNLLIRPRYPDITIISSLADYPAAVVHPKGIYSETEFSSIGTGPYKPDYFAEGERAVLVRNDKHEWWGYSTEGFSGAYLDKIEFIDTGTDPYNYIKAIELGQIDMLYQNTGVFIDIADSLGWAKYSTNSSATLVLRQKHDTTIEGLRPFSSTSIRQAFQLAIKNEVCLELGYDNIGDVAENHHICPIHPEYAEIEPTVFDPQKAQKLLYQSEARELEFTLHTLDDEFNRNTGAAAVAQLKDAGFKIKQIIVPEKTYRQNWSNYDFSVTEWNHRALGIQIMSLAYRSNQPWNETGYSNDDFDNLVDQALGTIDVTERKLLMAKIEKIMLRDAVIIQPFWRHLYRHTHPNLIGAEIHPTLEIHLYKLGWKE